MILIVASTAAPANAQHSTLRTPEGSHPVGYWRESVRAPATAGAARTLLLEVWYPASTRAGATKPYATPWITSRISAQLGVDTTSIGRVTTHAREGVPVAAGQHPVVVFSHGLSWPVTLYQSITESLAAQGYVVVGVNHPGGAPIDYGNGTVAPFEPPAAAATDSLNELAMARLAATWAGDVSFVLDRLSGWHDGTLRVPVTGRLDLARIALAGHSLGASAAARVRNPRVKAVLLLEGKYRDSVTTHVVVGAPLLHLIGEYNRLELEGRDYRPGPDAPVYQAVLGGTGHAYFSDLIALYRPLAPDEWRARHRYELDPDRILQITVDYMAAFLGRYLRGIDSVLLHPVSYSARVDGPRAAGYPEVRLTIDAPP